MSIKFEIVENYEIVHFIIDIEGVTAIFSVINSIERMSEWKSFIDNLKLRQLATIEFESITIRYLTCDTSIHFDISGPGGCSVLRIPIELCENEFSRLIYSDE